MCVSDYKKKLTKVRNKHFLNQEREHHIPVTFLFPSLSILFPKSRKPNPRTVLISIDASEDPRLGFTFLGSHLDCQHPKTQQLIEDLITLGW